MVLFAMLGTLMYCSKILMEVLPNIHLLGMFTMVYTICFRKKALVPIYIYIFLNGLFAGFSMWWIPYLYIWTILWAITMLLPQNMSKKIACIVYPLICALHGCVFGTLYAPAHALMFHLTFEQTIAWIITGLPWDLLHGAGNLMAGMLIYPLSELIRRHYTYSITRW
ncbi:MAG: hypothetical protein IKL88_05390 [Erysipelotrichales bacterium]|nr:hypothetical protein [Erysipelotrichales bacterium]